MEIRTQQQQEHSLQRFSTQSYYWWLLGLCLVGTTVAAFPTTTTTRRTGTITSETGGEASSSSSNYDSWLLRRGLQEAITDSTLIHPGWRDEVHAVWLNGPAHRSQLGSNWPPFGASGGQTTGSGCNPNVLGFSGYSDFDGRYCQPSSSALNDNPHLLLYSGKVALLLDASQTAVPGSVLPRLGATGRLNLDGTVNAVATPSPTPAPTNATNNDPNSNRNNDPNNTTNTTNDDGANVDGPQFLDAFTVFDFLEEGTEVLVTMKLECEQHGVVELAATPLPNAFAEFNVVRQGHAVTHVTVDELAWTSRDGQPFVFDQNPACAQVNVTEYGMQDNMTLNSNETCLAPIANCCQDELCYCNRNFITGTEPSSCSSTDYPLCVFDDPLIDVWGTCHEVSAPKDPDDLECFSNADCPKPGFSLCQFRRCYMDVERDCFLPHPWLDITLWGDSISIVAKWEPNANGGDICTGSVRIEATNVQDRSQAGTPSTSIAHTQSYTVGQVSLLLTGDEGSATLSDATGTSADIGDIVVTGSSGTDVLYRNEYGDIVME